MDLLLFLNLLLMYLYIFAGFIIGKIFKKHRDKIRNIGAAILIKVISPVQIFIILTTTTFTLSFLFIIQIILLALGLYAVMSITTLLFLRKKDFSPQKKGSHLLLTSFPNVMFFTIPIILSVFSEELIIVSVIFASTLMVLRGSISTFLCEKYGSEKSMNIKDVFKKLFTFPPFIAIIAASIVLAFQIPMPKDIFLFFKPPINLVSSAMGSLLIGMILANIIREEIKVYSKDIKIVVLWRFGISFLFFISIVYFLQFDPEYQTEIRTILLIICLGPSAVYSVIFSVYFNLEEKYAAITVASVTLISLIMLPFLIILGQAIF